MPTRPHYPHPPSNYPFDRPATRGRCPMCGKDVHAVDMDAHMGTEHREVEA